MKDIPIKGIQVDRDSNGIACTKVNQIIGVNYAIFEEKGIVFKEVSEVLYSAFLGIDPITQGIIFIDHY